MATYDSAANIVNEVAVEVGVMAFSAKPADPFASTDANVGQLCQLLKPLGRELWRKRQWTQLQSIYTFSTVTNQPRYGLPPDYGRAIDQSFWNRTSQIPLSGPLSPQQYEALKGRAAGLVWNVLFRQLRDSFQAFPDASTPGGYVIAYEYISNYWVAATGTQVTSGPWLPGNAYTLNTSYVVNGGRIYKCKTTGTSGSAGPTGTGTGISDGVCTWDYVSEAGKESPTASTDVLGFDAYLLTRGLKLAFLRAKGFDTTAAEVEFQSAFEQTANDEAAPVLGAGGPSQYAPLLGASSVPDTGFGS